MAIREPTWRSRPEPLQVGWRLATSATPESYLRPSPMPPSMAQGATRVPSWAAFFQGLAEATGTLARLDAVKFSEACKAGAANAREALTKPREGTILTLMSTWATSVEERAQSGVHDIAKLLEDALVDCGVALRDTTRQLDVLREANVVDAGALGFVDALEGIRDYVATGAVRELPVVDVLREDLPESPHIDIASVDQFRYCVECVVSGEGIDRIALREALLDIGGASLVIAGSKRKARVHMHVDDAPTLFECCERFGVVTRRKADDMRMQQGSRNNSHRVAVMTDSAADLPEDEEERLGIYIVPLRIQMGDRQHLDRVSITPAEFYQALRLEPKGASTSQPPPGDFRRQFEFLLSHHPGVVSVNASSRLSGTFQSAKLTAERVGGNLHVVDARNVAAGQGLLAISAAEAADAGCNADQVRALITDLRPLTRTWGVVKDLSYGVKGGRVPPWVKRVADWLNVHPVLASARSGTVKARGVVRGSSDLAQGFAKYLRRRLDRNERWRIMVAHGDWPEGGQALHDALLSALPNVHSSYLTAAGTAFGVHAGPGSLVVGAQPYRPPPT